jgi:hypothetical protein
MEEGKGSWESCCVVIIGDKITCSSLFESIFRFYMKKWHSWRIRAQAAGQSDIYGKNCQIPDSIAHGIGKRTPTVCLTISAH